MIFTLELPHENASDGDGERLRIIRRLIPPIRIPGTQIEKCIPIFLGNPLSPATPKYNITYTTTINHRTTVVNNIHNIRYLVHGKPVCDDIPNNAIITVGSHNDSGSQRIACFFFKRTAGILRYNIHDECSAIFQV